MSASGTRDKLQVGASVENPSNGISITAVYTMPGTYELREVIQKYDRKRNFGRWYLTNDPIPGATFEQYQVIDGGTISIVVMCESPTQEYVPLDIVHLLEQTQQLMKYTIPHWMQVLMKVCKELGIPFNPDGQTEESARIRVECKYNWEEDTFDPKSMDLVVPGQDAVMLPLTSKIPDLTEAYKRVSKP